MGKKSFDCPALVIHSKFSIKSANSDMYKQVYPYVFDHESFNTEK
jgi:hypothetical protein